MHDPLFVAKSAPVASAVADVAHHLSTREQARLEGVSSSTICRRRQKAAKAQATQAAPADLAAAVQALVTAQAQQSALLSRLLGGETEIQVPRAAKEPKAAEPEEERPVAGGTLVPPDARTVRKTGRAFVLSCAQNNTHVNADFMDALLVFCQATGAELLISRFAYNKDGWGQPHEVLKDSGGLWYDPAIEPYVCDTSTRLAEDLVFCGELNISPVRAEPFAKFKNYTKSSTGIIPHAKAALKSMPVMKGKPNRFLLTTGTVTQANYIQREAGQVAEHHHTYGAVFVELDSDGFWWARHLIADGTGAFHDLDRRYSRAGVERRRVECIVYGDIHIEKASPDILAACWEGSGSIAGSLQPRVQVLHDVIDFTARNHHNIKDPHWRAKKHWQGGDSVEGDVQMGADFLVRVEREDCLNLVIPSNHQDALAKWLKNRDAADDAENAWYWHWLNAHWHKAIRDRSEFDAYVFATQERAPSLRSTKFVKRDESVTISAGRGDGIDVCRNEDGVEVSMHGDVGINGARPSLLSFSALGIRTVTAHGHSPGMSGGQAASGVTGDLDMEYNVGPSSWAQAHVLIHENSKRQVVVMRGPRWRARQRVRVPAGRAAA